MSTYIKSLGELFTKLHDCKAKHVETVPVTERFQGQTVWEGQVEVFDLKGHPKASTGYAWGYDKVKASEGVAVLGITPVVSPLTAVRAFLLARIKQGRRN
jgi:hypothetical protein